MLGRGNKEYVVVTGASSGIGRALAICFAKSGKNVLAVGRKRIELERTKFLSGASEKNIDILDVDFTEEKAADKVLIFFKEGDTIKYLIHSAAITEPHTPLTKMLPTDFDKAMAVNVKTPLFLTKQLRPYFHVGKSRVLFIGSDYVGAQGKIRPNIAGAYGMSKSALAVCVEYLRHEFRAAFIGCLNPGATQTPMFSSMMAAQGIFKHSVQPTNPDVVAVFIQIVLEETSAENFSKINWDYRKREHHLILRQTLLRSAL